MNLSTVLTIPQNDAPTIRVKCKGESVPHRCRSGRQLTVDDALAAISEAKAALDEADVDVSVTFADGER